MVSFLTNELHSNTSAHACSKESPTITVHMYQCYCTSVLQRPLLYKIRQIQNNPKINTSPKFQGEKEKYKVLSNTCHVFLGTDHRKHMKTKRGPWCVGHMYHIWRHCFCNLLANTVCSSGTTERVCNKHMDSRWKTTLVFQVSFLFSKGNLVTPEIIV